MEITMTCSLVLLEMTFVLVGLLLLHGLRKVIGNAAFYFAMGLLLVLTQLVNAAELKVVFGYPGADFYIAPSVLFLPYLTIFMIVYVTEGTLMAQRLIIGAMATLGLYIYLSHLTALQCNWAGYTISQGPTADSMDYLLRQSQHTMAGTILAQTLDFFLIPIFFQRLRNLRCRMFFCIVGALMLTQIVDTFVYTSAVYWGEQQWWLHINSSYIAKAVATVWLSILATIYVLRIEKDIPGEGRGTLDIILAFFGSYGKAQTLQQHIREWEGRYRMVVENASDMILLLNHKGIILDANFAAIRIFKKRFRKDLLGQNFPELVFDRRNKPIDWGKYAPELPPEDTDDAAPNIQHLSCIARTEGTNVELDLAMTGINVQKQMMLIVFGRDVTEDNRLSREKEELREQLAHAQRLESIGKLAGGVAHDFNNYVHALQGHLDIIKYMHDIQDEDVNRHLEKINMISEQAGELTQQLLGFARKGKCIERILNLPDLVEKAVELFMPQTLEGLDFELKLKPLLMRVRGDQVQLQQVLLNLFINARDAMEDNERESRLEVMVDEVLAFDFKWQPPGEVDPDTEPEDFFCIGIKDNGDGIDPDVLPRIFEPFFTTKPFGKGTGMGLAMAYGTITNHKGWIQVDSSSEGTAFYIILPKASETKTEIIEAQVPYEELAGKVSAQGE